MHNNNSNEPVTPSLTCENDNYWNPEDSGYHTSCTPGTLDSSEISTENWRPSFINRTINYPRQLQLDCYDLKKDLNCGPIVLKYRNAFSPSNESYNVSPQFRRGLKRLYKEESEIIDLGPCSIRSPINFSSVNIVHKDLSEKGIRNEYIYQQYPTTPVKKKCETKCHLNLRQPNFVIHSISCESQALQPKPAKPNDKQFHFKPNQKIDIIKMLYKKSYIPPIMKIFSYLSSKDIYNITLVSPLWKDVWEDISKGSKTKKEDYLHFVTHAKDNQENILTTPKKTIANQIRPLMEICNIFPNNHQTSLSISTPESPRTIRFNKYTKVALMDPRKQLPCVICRQPAKLNEESSGEEWLECTNSMCASQFCRYCKLERHPGKSCIQYDLDGPSPSKRKKNTCFIGSKKSKRNLRRL